MINTERLIDRKHAELAALQPQRSDRLEARQWNHAIVMGASIAGLAAARVLSDHFNEVVLVERDRFGEMGTHRRGVPQSRHTHGLLVSGLKTLEGLFPGLLLEAMNAGALRIDATRDAHWWYDEGEQARFESGLETLCITRPLLEGIVRERVRRIPNVLLRDDCQVQGLIATPERVTGIKLSDERLDAELVVDATGRGSRSPVWLEAMGYGKPREDRIEVNIVYSTRRFRRSPHHLNGASLASIVATPANTRGGIILAQEGDSWTVTLYAYGGAAVPTGLPEFIEFARTLPASYIYDVISQAEPIGDAEETRFPASLRRRYEDMSRFPEGYLILGDAISSFNPVYGQGMSVAALEALELHRALTIGSTMLARRFFPKIAKIVDIPWSIAAGNDLRFSGVAGSRSAMTRFLNWYVSRLHAGAVGDSSLAIAFQKVTSLLAPPHSLLKPGMIVRVLAAAFPWQPTRRGFGRPAA